MHCGWISLLVGLLASLSLQIASVASEHHIENNGSPNQCIRVKITPQLSKIHLSFLVKSSRIFDFWLLIHTESAGALVELSGQAGSGHGQSCPASNFVAMVHV